MKICGIICEYNPFHNGHAYQIQQTRKILGEDAYIVCLMSGNFVQRGDIALYHKSLRARAAVMNGADLVLELPLPYALSSAERFARSGVDILSKIGCTHLSFGAESENIGDLYDIASLLLEKSTIDETLSNMSSGISYALARERAVFSKIKEKSVLLKSPNNILAIEYIKAIISLESKLEPIAIKRHGAQHDSCKMVHNTASATHIRQCIAGGHFESMGNYIPKNLYTELRSASEHRISNNEDLILSQLIRLSAEDFKEFSDVSEGLEHRLYDAVQSSFTFDEICEKAKSKRYAHSRIRRILMNAFLGIKRTDIPLFSPYVKVLAFNNDGRDILSKNRENDLISIITKPAHIRDCEQEANSLFDMEIRAGRLYHMFSDGEFISEFVTPQYITE